MFQVWCPAWSLRCAFHGSSGSMERRQGDEEVSIRAMKTQRSLHDASSRGMIHRPYGWSSFFHRRDSSLVPRSSLSIFPSLKSMGSSSDTRIVDLPPIQGALWKISEIFSRQIRDDRVGCERGRETVVARLGRSSPGDATSDETDQSATTGSKGGCPLSTLRVRLEEPRRVCRSNRAGFDRSNRRHPPGIILSAPRSNRDALLIIYLTQDPLEYEARRGEGSRWRESRSYVSRRPPTLHVVCVSTSPLHKQTVDRIRARGV